MFYKTRMLSRMLATTDSRTEIPDDIEHSAYMFGQHFGMRDHEASAFGTALMFLTDHISREDIADIFQIDLQNGLIMFNNCFNYYPEKLFNILRLTMDAHQVAKAAAIAKAESNIYLHSI